jgi:hypothetical protein
MRRSFPFHLAAAALLLPVVAWAQAPHPAALHLENRGGFAMKNVYVRTAGAPSWGENRLGGRPVPPGEARDLRFEASEKGGKVCTFDVKVVYGDGHSDERSGVDLCRDQTVAFPAETH